MDVPQHVRSHHRSRSASPGVPAKERFLFFFGGRGGFAGRGERRRRRPFLRLGPVWLGYLDWHR